jgi:hypothetical protein
LAVVFQLLRNVPSTSVVAPSPQTVAPQRVDVVFPPDDVETK